MVGLNNPALILKRSLILLPESPLHSFPSLWCPLPLHHKSCRYSRFYRLPGEVRWQKVSRQTVTPSVTPFPKSTILSTKKGGTTTSHKNTSKMPFILRSKPVETLFLRMAAGAARNKRRLLYYSPFRTYRTVPGKPCVK